MSDKKLHSSNNDSFLTRRQALKILGSGAMLVAAESLSSQWGRDAARAASQPSPKPSAGNPTLQAFALSDVRLLDGPFLEAQKRDEAYLLKLEPDRMLHNFRVNAGLEPKAPIYGGWESVQTWADIRAHGHTLGHYLTAASLMYASTGHDEMKQRVDYIVGELKECQDAGKTGLICAFPDKAAQIDNLVAGRRAVGVPWYTLHKIFAGLRDAHLYLRQRARARRAGETHRLGGGSHPRHDRRSISADARHRTRRHERSARGRLRADQ